MATRIRPGMDAVECWEAVTERLKECGWHEDESDGASDGVVTGPQGQRYSGRGWLPLLQAVLSCVEVASEA